MSRHALRLAALGAALAATVAAACSDSTGQQTGTVRVQLTDAPFSSDSVSRVDAFIVRIDARTGAVSDDAADTDLDEAAGASHGWTTIATPNQLIELLALRDGVTLNLALKTLPVGTYQGFRLIIDPSQSSITLKNGAKLTSTTTPNVSFPSAARTGIKIVLDQPLVITAGDTTTFLVDFDVDKSFVMRGNSIAQNGLNFTPVVRATMR